MVTISGYEDLSAAQQEVLRLRLVDLEKNPALDVAALHSALTALSERSDSTETPPPDPPEIQLQVNIEREAQARKTLEEDGCVPCYAVGLDCPPPEDVGTSQGVISYFKKYGDGKRVLESQLRNWEKFRNFQARNRRYFLPRNTFAVFEESVRARRRKYKLKGDASLDPDPKEQRPLDNWMEFQDYHLMIREELEQKVKKDKETLISTQREADGMEDPPSKMLNDIRVYSYRIDRDSNKRKRQEPLLEWIEQQRLIMVADGDGDERAGKDHGYQCESHDGIQDASHPQDDAKKRTATSLIPVLPQVAKKVTQLRNLRPRTQIIKHEADHVASKRPVPKSPTPEPRLCTTKRQRTVNELPSPVTPKREAKAAKHSENENRNRLNRFQPSTSLLTKTRAGRISKKPEKLGFA